VFRYENEPGRQEISGAQDAIGICVPGLSRHYYNGAYWPEKIETCHDESILSWLEAHLSLILLWPREPSWNVFEGSQINEHHVKALARAADACWESILAKDLPGFAQAFMDSFNAQRSLFPAMVSPAIEEVIDRYSAKALAWKLAGAGGGGYMALVTEKPLDNAIRLKIRRKGL
jgi:hypothetical protein